jgi:hypothetical protein
MLRQNLPQTRQVITDLGDKNLLRIQEHVFGMDRFRAKTALLYILHAMPLQALTGPHGSRRLKLPDFLDNRHMKVARLSVLRTVRLYPHPFPGTHFCYRLSRPQGHSAAGRMSMKNYNDTIGNRSPDLLVCSAVPQPTAPQRAPCNAHTDLYLTPSNRTTMTTLHHCPIV